jgi:hypothetical protein
MFVAAGDIFMLDHPTTPEQGEFAMNKAHINQLNPKHSLYQDRHPRLIYIPAERKKPAISMGERVFGLLSFEFRGPFTKGAL